MAKVRNLPTTGVFGTAHGFCLLIVSMTESDKVLWCQNLYIAHYLLNVIFANTALFSLIFRSVLVRFADRGLVVNGEKNLKFFKQLFWTILIPYCCIGLVMAPLLGIYTGSFKEAFHFKVCARSQDLEAELSDSKYQNHLKKEIVVFIFPALSWGWCEFFARSVRQFFKKQRPTGRMHSFGNYRRNFVTFEENLKYIKSYFFFNLVTNLVWQLNMLFFKRIIYLNTEKMFLMQFWANFIYLNVFNGLFLPMKMTIARDFQRKNFPETFWQRKSLPEPRRGGWSLKRFSTSCDLSQKPALSPAVTLESALKPEEIEKSPGNSALIPVPTIRLVRSFKKEMTLQGENSSRVVEVEVH